MTFAFIIMGPFDDELDQAAIHDGSARLIGVANLQQACQAARRLQQAGIGCIELCGAFGPEGAQAVIEATQNQIPVGYVTHLPQQDALYASKFGTATIKK
ncbi:MAG: DUF6506 family protein [Oscillospiraceae bacterium]|nr:DUF6506 family protein [Oscillospiraceae bacterium]MDD4368399.1 DUF6506 family protein [Oscillospiraceae bacterium]